MRKGQTSSVMSLARGLVVTVGVIIKQRNNTLPLFEDFFDITCQTSNVIPVLYDIFKDVLNHACSYHLIRCFDCQMKVYCGLIRFIDNNTDTNRCRSINYLFKSIASATGNRISLFNSQPLDHPL